MKLESIVKHLHTIAVICSQWGDTGKGKISDYLASTWADIIMRGTGGNNAGHTVKVNGEERIFHLLPAGIRYDNEGKTNILGNGMVLDLEVLTKEMEDVKKAGYTHENLVISEDAHIILPVHIEQDRAKNQSLKNGGIGSTGNGIGNAYTAKVARSGVMVKDLFRESVLRKKVRKNIAQYTRQVRDEWLESIVKTDRLTAEQVKESLEGISIEIDERIREELRAIEDPEDARSERLVDYCVSKAFSIKRWDIDEQTEDTIKKLEPLAKKIQRYVKDTNEMIPELLERKKNLLLEGAQGTLLSIEYGTYPYVTSSDASIDGAAQGVGLSAADFDLVLFLAKFPFMTRVGGGPFPTEFGGTISEKHCSDRNMRVWDELEQQGIPFTRNADHVFYKRDHPKILELCRSEDPFLKGIGVRLKAGEYGATTKRPRRTGATDLEALRYAVNRNGHNSLLVLTKTDCMADTGDFNLCTGYEDKNQDPTEFPPPDVHFKRDPGFLRTVRPIYDQYDGYGNISGTREYERLPQSLKDAIKDTENYVNRQVFIVSTGADQKDTIIREDVGYDFLLRKAKGTSR